MPRSSKSLALAATIIIVLIVLVLEWRGHTGPQVRSRLSAPRVAVTASPAAARELASPATAPSAAPKSSAPAIKPSALAQPEIISMSLSSPVAVGGQVLTGTVITSPNVVTVEAHLFGYSSTLTKVRAGQFTLSYLVPTLPFFLHRTYSIEVIARNAKGDAVASYLPITVR